MNISYDPDDPADLRGNITPLSPEEFMKPVTDRLERGRGWRDASGKIVFGPRAELAEWLRGIADGCLGDEVYRAQADDGAQQVADGAMQVQVGHTWYVVDNNANIADNP